MISLALKTSEFTITGVISSSQILQQHHAKGEVLLNHLLKHKVISSNTEGHFQRYKGGLRVFERSLNGVF